VLPAVSGFSDSNCQKKSTTLDKYLEQKFWGWTVANAACCTVFENKSTSQYL